MAVQTQTPFKEYVANGITTVFPLEFDCDKSEFLIVSLDGNEAPLGTWTLFNNTVTFNAAPANGVSVTFERNTPYQRTNDYQSYNNSFRPAPVNKDFDLIWWKLQELGYRDQVIWLALIKEISDRIEGDENLQDQINTIDEWLANLQQNVNENTNDIAQLVADLSREIADRITGDQILKDLFLSMIDEAINEGTINALAITHLDSLSALEGVTNVWDGRTIYIKDLGNYRYDALTTSWVKAYQDADNVRYGSKTQKQVNDDQTLFNDKYNKFKQPETGASERDLSVRARDVQYADDYSSLQNAFNAKRSSTTVLKLGLKPYIISGSLSLTAYHYIEGSGFNSDVRFSGTNNGIVYTPGTGIQDDHAQRVLADFHIRGDNTGAGHLGVKTGTTIGYSVDNTGSYSQTRGLLINGHNIGIKYRKSYTNHDVDTYFRANKYGLWLEDVTSYTCDNVYARFNDIAAIYLCGGFQNAVFNGGAIEGNHGHAILVENVPIDTAFPKITLSNVYLESNGDLALLRPAVKIQKHPKLHTYVIGGSYWQNVANGVTNGVYDWGSSASLTNAPINGYHYCERLRVKDCVDSAFFNTASDIALDTAIGFQEPTLMLEYSPNWRGNGVGPTFQVVGMGRPTRKMMVTNEIQQNYPHISLKSASVTTTENVALNYGDGSWTDISFSVSGSFNNDYAQIASISDSASVYPNKLSVFLLKPTTDCVVGLAGAGTTTQTLAHFSLKAGTVYRMCCFTNRVSAGDYNLRLFTVSGSATISFLPIFLAKFKDFKEAVNFANMFCTGVL